MIKMISGDLNVMIPVDKIENSGIRHVSDLSSVKKIAKSFQQQEADELLPWKRRQKVNMDKIKSGELEACAEVVSELLRVKNENKLNSSEKRMLNKAHEFMISELKLVKGMNESKIERFLSVLTKNNAQVS